MIIEDLFILALFWAAYFIPTFFAYKRKHNARLQILITNTLLGWTGFAWLFCIFWASSKDTE